ncbi:MAG: hypothetical protein EBT26_07720 [Microbacteriaceae bacterium]|nr:hypothetical protein [Microbacteriaceae bacterium]
MLEDLALPAEKVTVPQEYSPSVTFDGNGGEAVLPPVADGNPTDVEGFLIEAGINPKEIEIIGEPRISRWQVARPFPLEPMWMTSVRIRWRRINPEISLPLLYKLVKATKPVTPKPVDSGKALIVLWSDLQVGKVDHRGNSESLIQRVRETQGKLLAKIREQKPEKIIFCDVGDTIENFSNAADMHQLQSNDLSIMQQIDLATSLAWETLKLISKHAPVVYLSVGSNHCQWRSNKQRIGKVTDDWGIYIGRTLARLSKEVGLPIEFREPAQHDESLAYDIFDDKFHILGLWHGHQSPRPDQVPTWWRQQSFGKQPVHAATIGVSGHFHHLRVLELGSTPRGTSRFWIQASTLDNGSNWWRTTAGEDSQPGLVCFVLERGLDFTGTVWKL